MNIEKGLDKIVKTIRVLITDQPGFLGKLTTAIGSEGGNIGDVRLLRSGLTQNVREITVYVDSEQHLERILRAIEQVEGIAIEEVIDRVQKVHEGGKIAVKSRVELETIGDVRKIYTPGVASICRQIQKIGRASCRERV